MVVAAMSLPACRSHKPTAASECDSVAKSESAMRVAGACSTEERVMIDEWYFYPDTIAPIGVPSDSTAVSMPKTGTLARRRVVQMRRNATLAVAKDTAAKEVATNRSSSTLTGRPDIGGDAMWLRLVLVVLAVAVVIAVARMRTLN